MSDLVTRIRSACAEVAERARHVSIRVDAISGYARALPAGPAALDPRPARSRGQLAAFWLILDAINFGSGWFPTLQKRPGHSGYGTIAAALHERCESQPPWTASELSALNPAEIAAVTGQDPGHELMALFARSLNDLGDHVASEHAGRFEHVIDAADGSAATLVALLAGWQCFADVSRYGELEVPFYKRAQIAAADLAHAGVYAPEDLHRLTMFADNLVPHVLRLDGILTFSEALIARIERGELIEHDSAEEIEIRACAVHAVELIVAARPGTCAAQIDQLLWNRGGEPAYKARPRHRSRCTAY